ncbi:hypothetical protein B0H16DRAFT_1467411 [Mycena metata]|uniref:Uncharacterized protein n=1 Tax=Mycena metata TaxID=1033252 RepID=A0AAD7MXC1_9AGAR|nr:hypothetical protein B0H16DRAFT_1467411 [Mycena metata]
MDDLPNDTDEDMEAYEKEIRAYMGRKLRRREASKAYNDRNWESRNLKKRERMAALRASRANEPANIAEGRRAAARVYREDPNVLLTSSLVTPPGSGSPSPVGANLQSGEQMATLNFTFIINEARAVASMNYDVACNLPLYAISSGSSSPVLITQSRAPSPVPASPSLPPYARRPLTPRPVYAVRIERQGEIFTTFCAAWARHRLLERQGRTPVLVVATSVVHTLDWIDTAPLTEEHDVVFREILKEAIAVYRQDDLDNSLDDSRSVEEDGSRPMVATVELVAELDTREARAHWRRMS